LDAVVTTAPEDSLAGEVVAGGLAAEELLELFELLPQPASKPSAASAGIRDFEIWRTVDSFAAGGTGRTGGSGSLS